MRASPAPTPPSCGSRSGNHHDLGLFGAGNQPPRRHGSIGLYHLAWQVNTIDELEEARMTLAELGPYTGESSHGATKSVYAADPDANEFEVMWMLPRAAWGEYADVAPIGRLDLGGEVALDRRRHGPRTERWDRRMSTAFPQPTAVTYGSSDSAVPLAVLLHERGSDADQIIGLAQHLSGQLVTSTTAVFRYISHLIVFPRAGRR